MIKYLADCLHGQEGQRERETEGKRRREWEIGVGGVGGYPNGLCGSWGAGNEDGILASSLQSTTNLHGLSAQQTAGHTQTQTHTPFIKEYTVD